jgi:hypothetical protein
MCSRSYLQYIPIFRSDEGSLSISHITKWYYHLYIYDQRIQIFQEDSLPSRKTSNSKFVEQDDGVPRARAKDTRVYHTWQSNHYLGCDVKRQS